MLMQSASRGRQPDFVALLHLNTPSILAGRILPHSIQPLLSHTSCVKGSLLDTSAAGFQFIVRIENYIIFISG